MGGKERQAWTRIVALLFALAAVAEVAGARPRPIRLAVLGLLRSAEAIAWTFVIAVARESGVGLAAPLPSHHLADDAARLARSFAAAAELLAGLARPGPSPLPQGRIGGLVSRLALPSLAYAGGMRERASPDTS